MDMRTNRGYPGWRAQVRAARATQSGAASRGYAVRPGHTSESGQRGSGWGGVVNPGQCGQPEAARDGVTRVAWCGAGRAKGTGASWNRARSQPGGKE